LDNTDPVVFLPTSVNSVAVFQGVLGAAQQVGAGALAGVVPKNRTTGQILEADLGFAAPIGTLIENTTGGKVSYAWVYKNVTGTLFQLTQPMVPATIPFDFSTSTAEVDTWANGDTFVAYAPVAVNIVKIETITPEFVLPNFPCPVQLYHLRASCADGVIGDANLELALNTSIIETILDSVPLYRTSCDDVGFFWSNCFFGGGTFGQGSAFAGQIFGGAVIANAGVGISILCWSLNNDVILDSTAVGENLFSCPNAVAAFTNVCIVGELAVLSDLGIAFDAPIIWGPGVLNVVGLGRIFYTPGTATATFINLGGLRINGLTDGNAFDPTTGLWTVSIPITPANLDLAIVSGGFGGLAMIPGGATFTSRGTA
jgi:hypothetical protein